MAMCLGMGLISLDQLISEADNTTVIDEYIGGTCGNVLMILRTFGWDVIPITRLDDTVHTKKVKNEFILNNISTEFILTDGNCPVIQQHNTPKGKSDHYFTYLNKNNEPKFNFTAHTKTQMKDVIQKIDNVNIDVVFFDRISPSFMDMVNNIKSKNKNTLIVFEPSCKTDEKHFMDCVNLSHIIKFSEQRIPNINVFDSVNNKFIIQTRGKNGLIFKIRNSDWMEVPPVPLNGMKIVNSVGAGDWTTATLIDNLYKMRGKKLSNEEIKEALYSAQIGAVTSLGFKTPRK